MSGFSLSDGPIDIEALGHALKRPDAGAVVCFEGRVRDHHQGRAVTGLTYQAYAELALREGAAVLDEAMRRFDLLDAACVHRTGDLSVGELAVWVGACSGHRDAAFAGCRWIIDEVKTRVPIWKRERYADGSAFWQHPPETPR
jgi:molybdopterin synthase catalytic subunit